MLTKENIQDIYTLSPLQEGMFFNSLNSPSSNTYFEQQSFQQSGKLDIKNLERSLKELFDRHAILRTVFVFKKAKPLQIVLKNRNVDFYFEDISLQTDIESYRRDFKENDKTRFFDLSKDVLMRVAVLQIDDDQFELIWSWHHILMDAWCVSVLKNDFFEIYNSLQEGKAYNLPTPVPYRNFIQWLERKDKQAGKTFWNEYLSDFREISTLSKTNVVKDSLYQKEELYLLIDQKESDSLSSLFKKQKVTLNSILHAIWGILLSKYNNNRDVVFGSVVSGRPSDLEGVESMVGLFINTLPIRIKYDEKTTFLELLRKVQANILQRDQFSYCSLSEIQAQCEIKSGLINHILLFQNFLNVNSDVAMINSSPDEGEMEEIQTLNVESFEQYYYDFNLFIIPGDVITILIKYNSSVYDEKFVQRLLNHFKLLISQIVLNPDILITKLALVDIHEKENLIKQAQDIRISEQLSLKELFEKQVQKTPLAIAVQFENFTLNYVELNNESNKLANYLSNHFSVRPNDIIGIMMERSERLIIAILGIMKTGAAFLPIDPSTPPERKKYFIQNSGIKLLLTDFYLADSVEKITVDFVALDIQLPVLEKHEYNPFTVTEKSDLAYVIYTSGSTGVPKGVKVSNSSFLNYILWANDFYFKNENGKNFALFTPLSFDLTLTSIFSPLLRGDKLVVCDEGDIQKSLEFIFDSETEITAVKLTPAHISFLGTLNVCKTNVSHAIVGGDALTNKQVKILKSLNSDIRIFNEYGPTEATVGCMVKEISDIDDLISIGTPINNTGIFILDQDLNLQPEEFVGEIYISGDGLAKGYLNDDILTEKKFINNPFDKVNRLYRSGDLGRRLRNGEIEFLGRSDNQFKIRGYRIELGEIENCLAQYEGIKEVVVLLKDDEHLAAYIVASLKIDIEQLKIFVARFIPSYMIPSFFVQLDSISLNQNSKIDRSKLLTGNELSGSLLASCYKGPERPVEEKLVVIWKEILELEKIGIHDKFFDIGGHSLKAIQITTRIHQELNIKIEIGDIFEYQTIEKIADLILTSQQTLYDSISAIEEQEYYDVSPAQEILLIAQQFDSDGAAYNIPKGYVFNGDLDIAALKSAFLYLINRHESLRTKFFVSGGKNKQKIQTSINFEIQYIDLRSNSEIDSSIKNIAEKEANAPFSVFDGPHLRAKLFHIANDKFVFFLVLHHIISDILSNEILINEVLSFYKSFTEKSEISLKPLTFHYKDYSVWQNTILSKDGLEKHKVYWQNKFSKEIPVLNFPTDYPRSNLRTFKGGTENVSTVQIGGKLDAIYKKHEVTPFIFHLTCLKALIYRYTNQTDIIVGTVVSGREHSDLKDQIGFYINTLALNTKFNETDSFIELLLKVKATTIEAFRHQLYSYGRLVESLKKVRDFSRAPLFDIQLSFQSQEDRNSTLGLNGICVETLSAEKNSAIYDLTFDVVNREDELWISITYNVDLFSKGTIQQLGKNYIILIENIIKNVDSKIKDIDFTLKKERGSGQEMALNDLFNLEF